MKMYRIAIISNLPIIILKYNINFEKESKFIVVIPPDNPVLETVEAVSNITSKKKRIYAIFVYNVL